MLERIAEGRTDLVFEYVGQGHAASSKTSDGGSLLQWAVDRDTSVRVRLRRDLEMLLTPRSTRRRRAGR